MTQWKPYSTVHFIMWHFFCNQYNFFIWKSKHKNSPSPEKRKFCVGGMHLNWAQSDPCATNPEAHNLHVSRRQQLVCCSSISLGHKNYERCTVPDTCKPITTTLFNQATNHTNISLISQSICNKANNFPSFHKHENH